MFFVDNGKPFTGQAIVANSPASPSLAVHNDNLHIVWTDSSTRSLSIWQVALSASALGEVQGILGLTSMTALQETSSLAPALFSCNCLLILAWTSTKDEGNIYDTLSYDNGVTFVAKSPLDVKSDAAPALASHGSILFIVWKGRGIRAWVSVKFDRGTF
jgi:hypothetical protein